MQLATIGYEGASLSDFIATLASAGVQQVIDVREIAQSRRPGFSKSALRMALSQAGIDYHHVRQLGDPKHGREAARAGRYDLFREIFTSHLDLMPSRAALNEVSVLVNQKKSALVCFERDPKHCHRSIVAERLAVDNLIKIQHLGVKKSSLQGVKEDVRTAERFARVC